MGAPFPHRYDVRIVRNEGSRGTIQSPSRPDIPAGPPPEFDGNPQDWSPEHLLLASLANCMMSTFFAVASKAKQEVFAYESRAEGVLDKTKEGLAFTSILLQVAIRIPASDFEKGEKLLQTAKKYCLVGNALKPPITLETKITS